MNGYRKSKGIVIELTALLDVILIMLFWVMMSVRDGSQADADAARSEAVAANRHAAELEAKLSQKESELVDLKEFIEGFDTDSVELNEALKGYESGMLITLDIKYDNGGSLLISNADRTLGDTAISGEDEISAAMIEAFQRAGLGSDDVILCALIYDGSTALYKDVKAVNKAFEGVRDMYGKFYCADINTAKRSEGIPEVGTDGNDTPAEGLTSQ